MIDNMARPGMLFDLDGVLIDSETTYTHFWREIDRLYPTGIENFAMAIKGTTLPSIMKYFPDKAVQDDIVRRLFESQDNMKFPIYPGVLDFLKQLKGNHIPAAIVTSSDNRKMQVLYNQHPGFQDYFTAIIDASQVTRSKPDPQGYLKAAKAVGCEPGNCFVFEDSLQGLAAGRASGATVIGIASTYSRDKLIDCADLVVDSFEQITLDMLLSLRK